jgi:phosphosulfolactate synthase
LTPAVAHITLPAAARLPLPSPDSWPATRRAFACIELPRRCAKPRHTGLTMVLDKNLGLAALADLLDSAAEAIDLVKLGWGTSATQDRDFVRRKNAMLAAQGVLSCPGGTLFELAWLQGRVAPFLTEARALGFSCIEVSDGTVTMPHAQKLALISQVREAGFRVTSEVGSKNSVLDGRMGLEERVAQICSELDAGAWKVIIEARESGTQGLFDAEGATRLALLLQIAERVDTDRLILEAPQRSQQTALLLALGNRVNLGNIAPGDVVGLETLRLGLRSDTLDHFHLAVVSPEGSR